MTFSQVELKRESSLPFQKNHYGKKAFRIIFDIISLK